MKADKRAQLFRFLHKVVATNGVQEVSLRKVFNPDDLIVGDIQRPEIQVTVRYSHPHQTQTFSLIGPTLFNVCKILKARLDGLKK